jgi:hypothetical protein
MWIVAVFVVNPVPSDTIVHEEAYGPFDRIEDAENWKLKIFGDVRYRGNWCLILKLK